MGELLLTVSTATPVASLAISRGETVVAEVSVTPAATQSEILLPTVEGLLERTGFGVCDFDAFAVVHGPGAFTGLRVGISTVKGLATACAKPVVGVSSLQTLALQVPEAPIPVCALLDARKNEVYAGLFRWERGLPRLAGPEKVVDPSALIEELEGDILFVGDGSSLYRTLIVRQLGRRALFAPWSANLLRAGSAALLGLAALRSSETVSPENLRPVYIRASDAELNAGKTASDYSIEG